MASASALGQWKQFFAGLSPGKRLALVGVGLAGVGVVAGVAAWSGRTEYAPLFSSLSDDDASQIVQKLKEKKIPYQVEGRTVLVAADRAASLRLELKADGVPKGGGLGFEIFDQRSIGESDFSQKLKYRRALMGELARTIRSLAPVESARVHLVLPERSLYAGRTEEASASVVVKLKSGQSLAQAQVSAIVHLVASSVERLRPETVTVVDEQGRLLWKRKGDGLGAGGEGADDQDRALERRTIALLEPVVGVGKAHVRVSTELETSRKEETVEAFDPDSRVVRTEQEARDATSAGAAKVGGLPGAQSALAGGAGAAVTAPPAQGASRQTSKKSYELTKTVTRTVDPGGRVKKRSIAVLVDGRYEEKDGKRNFIARTTDELKNLEELVRGAVGFQLERGDVVTVRSIAFDAAVPTGGVEVATDVGPPVWHTYARWGALALAVLLFFGMVVRPLMRVVTPAKPAQATTEVAEQPGVAGARGLNAEATARPALGEPSGEKVEAAVAATPRQVALRAVTEDPRRAADIVRLWLGEKSAEAKEAS